MPNAKLSLSDSNCGRTEKRSDAVTTIPQGLIDIPV